MASKWGETMNDTQLFGEYSIHKIALGQFITICVVLLLMQPFFVCHSNTTLGKEKVSILYIIIISSLVVGTTYMLPLFKSN